MNLTLYIRKPLLLSDSEKRGRFTGYRTYAASLGQVLHFRIEFTILCFTWHEGERIKKLPLQ